VSEQRDNLILNGVDRVENILLEFSVHSCYIFIYSVFAENLKAALKKDIVFTCCFVNHAIAFLNFKTIPSSTGIFGRIEMSSGIYSATITSSEGIHSINQGGSHSV